MASITASSSSPTKIEIMAGGASLAPRRWSLPGVATAVRSRSAYSSTALMTAVKNTMNCRFCMGVSPGSSRVLVRGAQRPVVVLAAAVDALERLLVQQADQAVAGRQVSSSSPSSAGCGRWRRWRCRRWGPAHAGRGRPRCAWSWRGMPSFHSSSSRSFMNSETTGRITPEIMFLQLLALRRRRAEQRAAGQHQVQTLVVVLLADQEIFLLRADGGGDPVHILAEQVQHPARLVGQRGHRAQQRGSFCPAPRRCRSRRRWGCTARRP